jgi:hypothetical protein
MRVLFVTNDQLGQRRSGPAIRCLELARVLAAEHEVTVASAQPGELTDAALSFVHNAGRRPAALRRAAAQAEIVVAQGLVLARFPFLRRSRFLVIDLYDPYLFEYLAHPHPRLPEWGYLRQWHLLNRQLLAGDFFLCANERQWDYWLGRLCALGRLLPGSYRQDVRCRRLLEVVPFGLAPATPQHGPAAVLKGVVPGIARDDIVLLWAGGIWQWFDPLTIIRAMSAVSRENPRIRLVFLGTVDPNPGNRPMALVQQAQEEARRLALLDRSVFFLSGWVPFEKRQDYLLEADLGVSAHPDTVETRFAFRTRVLDYLWAGLPMLLTRGDYFAEMAEREGLGLILPPGDVEAWARGILCLAGDSQRIEEIKTRLAALTPRFAWKEVARPLAKYCTAPYCTLRKPPVKAALASMCTPLFEWWRRSRRG